MKQRDDDKLMSRVTGNDGESRIHGSSSAGGNRGKAAEPAYQQWRSDKSNQFPEDVGQKGNGPQSAPLYVVMKMLESE